jgi:predicted glycoside hydrolase/deacetylase ChbG (UPF0249 family)
MKHLFVAITLLMSTFSLRAQEARTYAERLGFPKDKKVIIFHVDDAGMSYDSNVGTRRSLNEGVATSTSVMVPCGWTSAFMREYRQHPRWDVGLHLTLTSEWDGYRWYPLTDAERTPGLHDAEGAFWKSVPQVVQHASADEVEAEIRAQLARFRLFGTEPTHLDSHMGTLFQPKFLERYVRLGITEKIPVMMPAGHNTLISAQAALPAEQLRRIQGIGQQLWDAGLPVLDDLHNTSYGWNPDAATGASVQKLQQYKTKKYIEALATCRPGLTMIILHATEPTEVFPHISGSSVTRHGDMLAMIDPELRRYIEREGIILTTWREVMERRKKR